jgi:hypothetical protein
MDLKDTYYKVLRKEEHIPKSDLVRLYEGTSLPDFKKSVVDVYEALTSTQLADIEKRKQRDREILAKKATQTPAPATTTATPTASATPVPQAPVATPGPAPVQPQGEVFMRSTPDTSGAWNETESKLYLANKLPGAAKDTGPGEYSVAALVVSRNNPGLYKEIETACANNDISTAMQIINKNRYIIGGSQSRDIVAPGKTDESGNEVSYEVKAVKTGAARTGAKGKRTAFALLNKVYSNIDLLHEKYQDLSDHNKNIVNQIKIKGMTVGHLIDWSHKYAHERMGELSRTCIDKKVTHPKVPPLVYLPDFIESLVTDPAIREVITPAVEELKKLYGVDTYVARTLDANIRTYLHKNKFNIGNYEGSERDEKQLSDFIIACMHSIFRDPDTFFKEVQSYFTPGTPENQKVLQDTFPVTGAFSINPQGYHYTGFDSYTNGLVIPNITQFGFKVDELKH